ncbi:glycosyltransferase [Flavobacterium algicola]|uniref:glycosyltransferase n=1 Tax=Flavobacterium algicola TaxID=556529 RepID=UPI001EFEE28F|nr:glycosyltransferase [Flavobacterium algicola]MCG9793893.1 glycosyltransferase [Flavobacterium algicola]
MPNPTVSIFMLTYNQEQFIGQAIDSILRQQTTFNIQLVIGEDYSTDATRQICEEFARNNGNRIKLLPSLGRNIGLIANYMRTIKECDGTYIAICDGDDYWIDDFKLQKQVDFLEQQRDYSMVYTGIQKLYETGICKNYTYHLTKTDLNFDDLVLDNFIHSVSVLFRNTLSEDHFLPSWIAKFPFGDWPSYLWTLKDGGKIQYLEDITAVYRMDIGVSAQYMKKNSAFQQTLIDLLEEMHSDPNFSRHQVSIACSILVRQRDQMTSYNRERSYHNGFIVYLKLLAKSPSKLKLSKLYCHSIYKSLIPIKKK